MDQLRPQSRNTLVCDCITSDSDTRNGGAALDGSLEPDRRILSVYACDKSGCTHDGDPMTADASISLEYDVTAFIDGETVVLVMDSARKSA